MKIFIFQGLLITIFMIPADFINGQDDSMKTDWPNLGRYSEENKALGHPVNAEERVVFMGNSITEGWIRSVPEFFEGRSWINRGISGQTTPQMLVRFRADVVNLKPAAVVILAGINDIAGNTGPSTIEMIQDNIASMAEIGHANNIRVILCSVLPAYDFPWRPGLQPAEKVVSLNSWISSYAKDNDYLYVDFFTVMADERNGLKQEYTHDGVHPTREGYLVMGPLAETAIRKALEIK